jgi:hypothetical protein
MPSTVTRKLVSKSLCVFRAPFHLCYKKIPNQAKKRDDSKKKVIMIWFAKILFAFLDLLLRAQTELIHRLYQLPFLIEIKKVIGTKQLCCNLNQSIALQIWCQLKY